MFSSKFERMSLYQKFTNQFQFITPKFYKKRYFKNLENLSKENYNVRNIEPELIWIKEYLNTDSVMIDIGANNGSFIYQLESKLLPQNIFAFEPNEKLYSRLCRIFPESKIYKVALSDRIGNTVFKIPIIKGKIYNSRGTLRINYKEENEEKHNLLYVKMTTLDEWQNSEQLTKLDFIKIDVEGNEMHTLDGAKNIIKKLHPTLMVEMEQRHHSESIINLVKKIEEWNYTAFFLNRSTFKLEKVQKNILNQQNENVLVNKTDYINNFIFIPNMLNTFP